LKRPDTKSLYVILACALAWILIGWMLLSLRNSSGPEQLQTSTLLLRILCAGASLLLLVTCICVAIGLGRIARDSESGHRFPPASAPQLMLLGQADGESAWLWAARLRGWAAAILALGLLIAGAGLNVALRAHSAQARVTPIPGAAITSAPRLVQGLQSTHPATPARSTTAPG
jgi:hypothetical protein